MSFFKLGNIYLIILLWCSLHAVVVLTAANCVLYSIWRRCLEAWHAWRRAAAQDAANSPEQLPTGEEEEAGTGSRTGCTLSHISEFANLSYLVPPIKPSVMPINPQICKRGETTWMIQSSFWINTVSPHAFCGLNMLNNRLHKSLWVINKPGRTQKNQKKKKSPVVVYNVVLARFHSIHDEVL